MAAWDRDRDDAVVSGRKTPVSTVDVQVAEEFPQEVWTFFSTQDINQLIIDAYGELGRRAA